MLFLLTMSFNTFSGPAAFGSRRPLSTAANPRPAAIVGLSQDPWAPYQLCPGASDTDKAAYALLRAEIMENDALSSVKELAEQKWWNQQNALTYDADRNSRLLSLLSAAISHHKATQHAAALAVAADLARVAATQAIRAREAAAQNAKDEARAVARGLSCQKKLDALCLAHNLTSPEGMAVLAFLENLPRYEKTYYEKNTLLATQVFNRFALVNNIRPEDAVSVFKEFV